MWRKIRISILLGILTMVAGNTYIEQRDATDWIETLDVVVYPINGDGSEVTERYIRQLQDSDFSNIARFMRRQGAYYEIGSRNPVKVRVADVVDAMPPRQVQGKEASVLDTVWFSLKMRWWAAFHDNGWNAGDIRMFVVYFAPEGNDVIPDSLALPKGLIGLVYAYADSGYGGTNNFVIAHEMLHTLGATDKYDPVTNMPLYPVGYANPYVTHRYPQKMAEIMGGRIPVDSELAYIPNSLDDAVIGSRTALEINWFN
jgi:hypothetical protein